MKRSTLLVGVAIAALFACKSQSADAGPNQELAPAALEASASDGAVALKDYACGAKGQPSCPLQAKMKEIGKFTGEGDGKKLATALKEIAGKGGPGMTDWASIANEGAAAADKGDIDGAKKSCKGCHDKYKKQYKEEFRDKAL